MRRALTVTLLTALLWCANARALPSPDDTIHRSVLDILNVYEALKPVFHGDPYVELPRVTPEYTLGRIAPEALEDALSAARFARYLAGLPYETLIIDGGLNRLSQCGAVLLAACDELSHSPDKPELMDQDFYLAGNESAASSNLYVARRIQPAQLVDAVWMFMSDSDDANLATLGHRRWLLNPLLMRTGFGLAQSETGGQFAVMAVYDESGPEVAYDLLCWPAQGFFPLETMADGDAWTITPNPGKYDLSRSEISILLENTVTGERFRFAEGAADGFFKVDDGYYGPKGAIIFRPEGARYLVDERWQVTLEGLMPLAGGEPVTRSYAVRFMSLEG